jgi:aspartate racemase
MINERQQGLVERNQTAQDYPRDRCVHQLFEEQVERTPDAVAVVFEDRSLTYRELNARANKLGHHLRSLGVGPDVLVGLCVERSLEMVVALLGILKAGGAYVPLDPHLPRERMAFLMQDIDAPVVLLQQRWREILPVPSAGTRTRLLALEELPELLAAAPRSNPSRLPSPDHLAYVLYTSGSTGTPKGVEIPHLGIVRLVIRPDYVGLTSRDVLLQFAPLSFDASTFEIWGSLLNGAKLVVCPARQLDYAELGSLITGHGVTTLWLTAALFHEMLEHSPAALAGVRQLLAGGDVLSPSKVRAYLEMPGHGRLINGYGPTENTTFTCCCGLDRAEQVGASVPIGRAIAGTRVHLLDPQGSAVPPGVVGELCIGGDGLARGYHNRPELTAERFIADPFGTGPGARIYKTGDLARHLPDGDIEFLGRIDFQVKIRGHRIEPGEIEAVLGGHPALAACSVVPKDCAEGDKTLTAFLVIRDPASLSVASLRAWLAEKLPDYMVPSRFLVLPALPLTPNGKVDREALGRFDGADLEAGTDHVPPRTELESKLLSIWQSVLRRGPIGIRDNFFDLGGHSLQAVKLTAEVGTLLGHTLPIAMLFQYPTIESLALWLTEDDEAPARVSLVPLQTKGAKPPLFFIHGGGGDVYSCLDIAQQLAPDQPAYGMQAVGLDGKTARHTSVEQMAAHYVQEVRSFQPEGPYHLSGYSVGGIIAFEMAQQLYRTGQEVAMLGLLDTYPTRMPTLLYLRFYIPNLGLYLLRRSAVHLRRWWKLSPDDRSKYIRGRWLMLRHWFGKTNWFGSPAVAPSAQTSDPLEVLLNDHYVATALKYRVRPYPGSVDLFSCDDTLPGIFQIWKRLARGGAMLHRLPGGHAQIIDVNRAPAVAKSLKAALQRTLEQENDS